MDDYRVFLSSQPLSIKFYGGPLDGELVVVKNPPVRFKYPEPGNGLTSSPTSAVDEALPPASQCYRERIYYLEEFFVGDECKRVRLYVDESVLPYVRRYGVRLSTDNWKV